MLFGDELVYVFDSAFLPKTDSCLATVKQFSIKFLLMRNPAVMSRLCRKLVRCLYVIWFSDYLR